MCASMMLAYANWPERPVTASSQLKTVLPSAAMVMKEMKPKATCSATQ